MKYHCKRYQVVDEFIDGRWQKVFKNRPRNVQEILDKTIHKLPQKEGFISGDTRLTFSEFGEQVDNVAISLQRDFQVKKGDRVALLLEAGLEFPICFFGTTKVGGIVVPLNTRLREEELTYEINDSESTILIMDQEFSKVIEPCRKQLTTLKHIFVNGNNTPHRTIPYSVLVEKKGKKPEKVETKEDETVMIMYTSGTTGKPKGAMQFHRGIIEVCMLIDDAMQSQSDRDRMLCVLPLFHSAGLIMTCLTSVFAGIPCVYMQKYKTKEVLEIIEKEKISTLLSVPAILWLMMNHPEFRKYDLSSIRVVSFGGSPKSPDLVKLFREKMPAAQLWEGYGMTETHGNDCILTDEEMDQNLHTTGRVVPIDEVKIVDDQGNECPVNVPGEIMFRGSKVISRYWKNPEETKRLLEDGWFHTGDVGKIDENGYMAILDRIKDMINRGGEKVYSLEIENVLYRHSKVMEAAVVGIKDEVFGEEVKACVVLKEGEYATEDEIKEHCAKYLADYKIPKVVEIFRMPLPHNSLGKIMKRVLKEKVSKV